MNAGWAAVLVAALGLGAGALGLVVRLTLRWGRIESDLRHLAGDMAEIVRDKDRVHAEIVAAMRDDRAATDRRLRWLEEHLWRRSGRGPGG